MEGIGIELKVKHLVEIMDFVEFFFRMSLLSTRQSSDTAIVAPDPSEHLSIRKKKKIAFQKCRNEKSPAKYLKLREPKGST